MAATSHENHNPNMDQNEGEGDTFDDIFDSYREKRVAEMKKAYECRTTPQLGSANSLALQRKGTGGDEGSLARCLHYP